MDALTHNIEAYLAKGFSPLCDGIALEGIKLIGESIVKATHDPDLEARTKMAMAALMGATAFQKGLGVVHSLAHPLSTLFDLHHGLANAIVLPQGVEFNAEVAAPKIADINAAFKIPGDSTQALIDYLYSLNQKLGLPTNLSSQGISQKDIASLSELAYKDPCHQRNPRKVAKKDFESLYQKAL